MTTRRKAMLLLGLLALLINLPVAHSAWTQHRIQRDGVDVAATVTDTRALEADGDRGYLVQFTLPDDVDPDATPWTAQVDRAAYDVAVASGRIEVRVLPEEPAAQRVEGQVSSRVGLWITLGGDVILVLMGLLLWRGRGTLKPELVLVATEDVQRGKPGGRLERLEEQVYVVEGEVLVIEPDTVVLDLGDRRVRVELDGHHNPVGYQQPARVTGRMIG